MESVLPGGLGGGALEGLSGGGLGLPAPSNPMAAPDSPTAPESAVPFGF